jgi:hypothetical protein
MNGKGFTNNKDNIINERELMVMFFYDSKNNKCALKAGKLNVRKKSALKPCN